MSRLDKLEKFRLYTDTNGITDTSIRHIEGMKSLKKVKIRKSKNTTYSNHPIFKKDKSFDYDFE